MTDIEDEGVFMRNPHVVTRLIWISGIFLAVFPSVGYAEGTRSKTQPDTAELNEKLKRDIEDMNRSLRDLESSQKEFKESQVRSDKANPWADKTLDLAKQEKYSEAQEALKEWEKIDAKDIRIPIIRDLIVKMEMETDPKKKERVLAEAIAALLGELTQELKEVGSNMEILNEKLKELGPKNPEEELCVAVAQNDKKKVQEFLDKGVRAGAKDGFGTTALMYSVNGNNVELARLLIARGADVNEKGFMGMTALISAASYGHAEIVRALIEAKADVNAKANTGITALSAAQKNGHSQVVDLLKQAGATE